MVKEFLISEGVYEANTPEHKITQNPKGWFYKVWGGGMQRAGIPDIVCNINGRFVALELKATNGIATELQKKNISLINKSNGIGLIVHPDDYHRLTVIIRGLINEGREQVTL